MSELTEFLLARVAEDEAVAKSALKRAAQDDNYFLDNGPPWHCDEQTEHVALAPSRILAEREAKFRMIEDLKQLDIDYRVTRSKETEARRFQALVSIGHLAAVYADHPDYRDEWKP